MRTHLAGALLIGVALPAGVASAEVVERFSPPAGQAGSIAIDATDPAISGWATGYENLVRGPQDIADPSSPLSDFGEPGRALGSSDARNDPSDPDDAIEPGNVVSLGDGGSIELTFDRPITNGAGFDFAVFENSINAFVLELAFVEVSSNGTDFFRFPSISKTPVTTQVGPFSGINPEDLSNLAGSFAGGFGTPFDLDDLEGVDPLLNVDRVTHVRIEDVVGRIDPVTETGYVPRTDAEGNIINEAYPTAFVAPDELGGGGTGGFDLDAVGVIHFVPEPGSAALMLCGALACGLRRRSR